MKVFENQEMKNYSNMRVGGKAKKLIILENKEDIIEVFNDKENTNIFFLGNGTNVLFTDDYMDKTFVCTKKLNKIENLGNNLVKVETGANLKDLTDFMKDNNYSGIESLFGIPGSIGGLVYMNGGAFGTEIFDKIVSVEVFDENHQIREIKKEDLKVAYRKTEIQDKNWLVLSATFKFDNGFDAVRVKEIKELRESKHPLDKPSLGSTFKNPEGDFAARLISECGLKGTIIGNAQIAEKHPNFILNLGNATFKDITDILTLVKKSVLEKFEIKLEEEIIIVR
ncbi:UDP-N-acetylenolpyruvoylglucosamine reductase [Fusobacterium polymorphum]|uniref:UDP-N-acetylenolpyruvoylglucosamine reductase n=1 Tax=Fusobacterium nucleatum subsp. polymorphum TaxID=76857 RepID=A0A2B7YLH6_FUSNP|nr:UDP-N-acetylmuramate dehydrogenase [Fusobacterium polymorphum]PGH21873.1 UDP-N-acetylenolpyruvoylglucosamine reductase [Fusobacterium polymorphum]